MDPRGTGWTQLPVCCKWTGRCWWWGSHGMQPKLTPRLGGGTTRRLCPRCQAPAPEGSRAGRGIAARQPLLPGDPWGALQAVEENVAGAETLPAPVQGAGSVHWSDFHSSARQWGFVKSRQFASSWWCDQEAVPVS